MSTGIRFAITFAFLYCLISSGTAIAEQAQTVPPNMGFEDYDDSDDPFELDNFEGDGPGLPGLPIDTTTLIIIIVGAIVVIIIIVIVMKKKK